MTAAEIVKQMEPLGTDSYRKVMINHGIREPIIGVKISDLKQKFLKGNRKDYQLALDLFETGIYDAQYLAGLMADEARMTKKNLRHWLAKSNCRALCGSVVAAVAAEGPHGWALALEWIDSKKEDVAQTGWATLSSLVSIKDDADLDLAELARLLRRVEQTIHQQPNHVRYAMNGFVISLGGYVKDLTEAALRAAETIGEVSVDMGKTACEVPAAGEYIRKIQKRGTIGKKRKTARC